MQSATIDANFNNINPYVRKYIKSHTLFDAMCGSVKTDNENTTSLSSFLNSTIGGCVICRSYRHIKQYEKELIKRCRRFPIQLIAKTDKLYP